jgi:hypothetical protein
MPVWLKHHAVLLPAAQLTSYCAKTDIELVRELTTGRAALLF